MADSENGPDRQNLAFRLERQTFALPVASVVQIIPMVTITPIPQASSVVEGVINVRGAAVPVVDLRRLLNRPVPPLQLYTPIVLTNTQDHMIGLVVDEVIDVLDLAPGRMISPSDVLPKALHDVPVLQALAHASGGTVLILDPDRLFLPDQAQALAEVVESLAKLAAEGKLEKLFDKALSKAAGNDPGPDA